jgi:uncharacterized protein (TIGR03084 family)
VTVAREVDVPDAGELLADLAAEGAALEAVVAGLEDTVWLLPTPADGWTVAHHIAHLSWTDGKAEQAARDPQAFRESAAVAADSLTRAVDDAAAEGATTAPEQLLARWQAGRAALAEALTSVPSGTRLPWFGPPMSVASMATARLMETWAHGLDVTDALGLPPTVSPRLRHVAHLGVRTRDFSFAQRGLPAPSVPFHVELAAPDGSLWAWGPENAEQRVSGPALDFCLRVTRRRNRADLALQATGAEADRWLDIAQAFAGPAGEDRPAAGVSAMDPGE